MKFYVSLISFIIFFASCSSGKTQKAATTLATTWQAENCTIEYSDSYVSDKGSQHIIIVTLKNIGSVDDKYSKELITSTSAAIFIKNATEEEYKGFDQLKIKIENKSYSFESTYEIAKLISNVELIKIASKFFNYCIQHDTSGVKEIISSKSIPDSILRGKILYGMKEFESTYGKLNKPKVIGFRNDSVKKTNEQVIIVWTQAYFGTAVTKFTFYVSEESKKIVYIGINDFKL